MSLRPLAGILKCCSKDFLENASCLVHSNRIRSNSGAGVSDVLKLPKSSPNTYLSLRTTALHRSLLFLHHKDFFVLFNACFNCTVVVVRTK